MHEDSPPAEAQAPASAGCKASEKLWGDDLLRNGSISSEGVKLQMRKEEVPDYSVKYSIVEIRCSVN